ncbi:hypothetical protein ACFW04_001449 [Cataglyphis niger]
MFHENSLLCDKNQDFFFNKRNYMYTLT